MGLFDLFKKKEQKIKTKEDEKLEKEIAELAPKVASRMKVYPEAIEELGTNVKKTMVDILKKEELSIAQGRTINALTINDWGSKKAFDEVVKMLCDEVYTLLKIKINPKDFIQEYSFKGAKLKNKFSYPLIEGNISEKESMLFNTAKKNVQLKIKGDKRYKDIDLIGAKKFIIEPSNVPRLLKIIENDEQLKNYNEPIFLNMQMILYTSIYDYGRYVNFAKKVDDYLELSKSDYKDITKRISDAVDENIAAIAKSINEKLADKDKIEGKKMKNMFIELSEQGAIKLIYMRNFTWNVKDLKKKQNILKKLSNLLEFMQSTLKSNDVSKDFLASYFEVSTDADLLPAYGCFAKVDNKAGIDESITHIKLPGLKYPVIS